MIKFYINDDHGNGQIHNLLMRNLIANIKHTRSDKEKMLFESKNITKSAPIL